MKTIKIFILIFSIIFVNNVIAQTVYTTKTGKKHHKENCKFLKYSKKETTIKKAKELGYSACKVCKPTIENTKSTAKNKATPNLSTTKVTKTTNKKATAIQCTGKTKKGTRCKRKTKNVNGRCYQH